MATREDLKTVPYSIYTPDELRKALSDLPAVSSPVPNKVELEDAYGGLVIAGKNTPDYGQGRNQNYINLLANFASEESAPDTPDPLLIPNPQIGQLWFNLSNSTLRLWNGTSWVASTSSLDAASVSFDDSGTTITAGNVQVAIEALDTALFDHINDPTDAHDASAISVSPVVIGESDVQGALEALEAKDVTQDIVITSNAAILTDHLTDTAGRHEADQITVTPSINGQTNVQSALSNFNTRINTNASDITDVENDLSDHITDTVDAHDASAISYSNGISGLTAFDVQAAIDELATGALGGVTIYESGNFASTNSVVRTVNLPAVFGNESINGDPDTRGPDIVMIICECVVADLNYTVGDITILDWQGNQFDEASNADDEGSYVTWRPALNDGRTVEFLINYNENVNRTMLSQKGFTGTRNFFNTSSTANWVFRVRAYKFLS